MEGRVPPSGDGNNDPLLTPSSLETKPSAKGERSETYVVQIPRDQVYRVPPPENARIVESYGKPAQQKKKCGCGRCCCWIILALILINAVVGIAYGISHLLFRPKSPEFHLTDIQAKNLQQSPNYEISILAENPNERIGASYKQGKASLVFKQNTIAEGGFPKTSQDSKKSTKIPLTLNGMKAALSNEIRKSLNDTQTKSMTLKIDVSVEMKGWINSKSKDITVTCDFKVSSLEKKAKVVSEDCDTNF